MIQLFGFAHLSCLLRFDFMIGDQARICAESGVDTADGFTNMKHERIKSQVFGWFLMFRDFGLCQTVGRDQAKIAKQRNARAKS